MTGTVTQVAVGLAGKGARSGGPSTASLSLAGASGVGSSTHPGRAGRAGGGGIAGTTRAGSDHHGGFTKAYLSQLVSRFSGCLSVIRSGYANVLTLRTGWGISHSYSRSAVARILHVSLSREGRIERRAVAAVARADSQGSCSRAEQATRSALFLSPAELTLLGQSVPRAFVSTSRKTGAAHQGQRGKQRHRNSSVSGASTSGVPGAIPSLAHAGTSSFPWLFIALGLVLATALASPIARRRWLHPRTVGGPVPSPAARRPGARIGRRAAERAGAVGAAAAAGATALRRKRTSRGARRGQTHPRPASAQAPTPQAQAESLSTQAPTPQAPTGDAAAAALGAGAVAAGAGAAASERERHASERERQIVNGDPAAASSLGSRLERRGDVEGALAAYRRADAGGDAAGATNLGVLLEQRGDLEGALAAYRRADERGDANGSFNLGCLLADRGDLTGAVDALQRADDRGDPAGASNLGVLLEQRGDFDGALAAYRRADERGDANGSFNLGLLLVNRGDLDGAQEAYRRASERGDPDVVDRARSALAELRENGDSSH